MYNLLLEVHVVDRVGHSVVYVGHICKRVIQWHIIHCHLKGGVEKVHVSDKNSGMKLK